MVTLRRGSRFRSFGLSLLRVSRPAFGEGGGVSFQSLGVDGVRIKVLAQTLGFLCGFHGPGL